MTFDDLLDQELDGLRRYAQVLTGNPVDAQDLVAEALLRVYLGWGRIGTLDQPTAYVRRVITNAFLSDRRRWARRSVVLTGTGALPETPLADPTGAVDDREQLHVLLSSLPRQQRAAVVLRYYLDLSDDDIGTELGITTGAVRTAISRALAALRIGRDDHAAADGPARPGSNRSARLPLSEGEIR